MFFKKKNDDKNDDLIKVAALLIHTAKIDENFTNKEEEIIEQTLIIIGALIFSDRMYLLASMFQDILYFLNLDWLSTI